MGDVKVRAAVPTFVARAVARPETRSQVQERELKFGTSWIEPEILVTPDGEVKMFCYLRGDTPLAKLFSKTEDWRWTRSGQVFELYGRIKDFPVKHFWIGAFYSRIHKDPNVAQWRMIATPEEANLLSGIGFSSLCYLLRDLVQKKLLSPFTMVALEASGGRLKDPSAQQGMVGLVNYYTSMGFSYVRPQALFYEILGHRSSSPDIPGSVEDYIAWQFREEVGIGVLMASTVHRILTKCPQTKQVVVPAAIPLGGAIRRR